jgi:hypothetical protein
MLGELLHCRQWNVPNITVNNWMRITERYTLYQTAGLLKNCHILWTEISEGKWHNLKDFTLSDARKFYALFSTAKSIWLTMHCSISAQ